MASSLRPLACKLQASLNNVSSLQPSSITSPMCKLSCPLLPLGPSKNLYTASSAIAIGLLLAHL